MTAEQKMNQLVLTDETLNTHFAEAYRTLRANISFSAIDRPVKTILVTSAAPREGKTTTVINLGIIMALAGPRRPPVWPLLLGVIAAGVLLGAILSGASALALLGTLAALLAIGAAIYRPALGLGILALTYPFDLTTQAGSFKVPTSYALLAILFVVWAGRQFFPDPPPLQRTSLDRAVAIFAGVTVLSVLGRTGDYSLQLAGQAKSAGGFLAFFLLTQSVRQRKDIWLVVGAFGFSGLVEAALVAWPVITGAEPPSEA